MRLTEVEESEQSRLSGARPVQYIPSKEVIRSPTRTPPLNLPSSRRGRLFLGGLLCWVACVTLHPRPLDPGLFLLSPAEAGFEDTLVQSVTWSHGRTSVQAQVVTEVTPQAVHLVALSPLGQRVLALSWDGVHLKSEMNAALPKDFPAELMLRDFQLTFWPLEAIRRALPPGWRLVSKGRERTVFHGVEQVIHIRYGADAFRDSIDFEHHSMGYRLTLQTADP